ncbi:hypothetical protein OSB04_000247 [Centaurea solstitialis]|uniref:Uncharacterized protein n=1 Tax=Centaurea solstitialis TaxID=347529 RepID=A0AA38TZ87_9ASTR|nr:hypothetical protein OSB04_000247 [Centaurea solstitialis]
MASPLLQTLLPLCLILLSLTRASAGDAAKQLALHLAAAADETAAAMSIYDDDDIDGMEPEEGEEDDDESDYVLDSYSGSVSVSDRRSLFWRRMRYYISYGALSANRVPCPPRSGRSYYTHNCWRARGPVRPYFRGCSTITRCRR